VYTPKEAQALLGVPGPTLRRWRAAFRPHLSADVDAEEPRYTVDDLQLLTTIQLQLRAGAKMRDLQEQLARGEMVLDVVVDDNTVTRPAPRPSAVSGAAKMPAVSAPQELAVSGAAAVAAWREAAGEVADLAAAIREQTATNQALLEELQRQREAAAVPAPGPLARLRKWFRGV